MLETQCTTRQEAELVFDGLRLRMHDATPSRCRLIRWPELEARWRRLMSLEQVSQRLCILERPRIASGLVNFGLLQSQENYSPLVPV